MSRDYATQIELVMTSVTEEELEMYIEKPVPVEELGEVAAFL